MVGQMARHAAASGFKIKRSFNHTALACLQQGVLSRQWPELIWTRIDLGKELREARLIKDQDARVICEGFA